MKTRYAWITGAAPTPRALCSAENGGEGGGGGSPGLNEQQVTEIVNRAFTARAGRLKEEILGGVQGALTEALKPINERLAAAPKDDKTKPKDDKAESPETAELRAKVEEMQAQLKAKDQAAAKERQDREAAERDAAIRDHLAKAGVKPALLDGALAVARGQVKVKDGKPVWVAQREGYVEELDLAKGVGEWANTETGKEYLAPRPVQGSGARPGQAPLPRGPVKPGSPEAAQERRDAARAQLQRGVAGLIGGTLPLG